MKRAKQLQSDIDDLNKRISEVRVYETMAPAQIAQLQSLIIVKGNQLAEISTRRLVYLTWVLLIVTIGLFVQQLI